MNKFCASWRLSIAAIGIGNLITSTAAQAGGTLTIGMTAGDLPITTGNPDQGFEGYRFVGYNLYDSLALWDLSKSDKAADIKPGLATEWQVDEANPRRGPISTTLQATRRETNTPSPSLLGCPTLSFPTRSATC